MSEGKASPAPWEGQEPPRVSIVEEDGNRVEGTLLTLFEAAGRDYVAILLHEQPEKDGHIIGLYRCQRQGEEMELAPIRDDLEFEVALGKFQSLMEESAL